MTTTTPDHLDIRTERHRSRVLAGELDAEAKVLEDLAAIFRTAAAALLDDPETDDDTTAA